MTDSLVQDAPGKSGAAVREPASASEASRMLEEVRALGPELRSRAAEVEAQSRVSDEMIRALHKIGVFKMTVPVEYGGYAFTPSQIVPVYAEITRACGSTGWVAWVTTTGTQWMTSYSHKLQEEMFLAGWEGPYQSGAMNKGGPGEGRRVEGGYMIKGKWPWSSGCFHTIFHTMGALIDEPDGTKYPVICQVPHDQVEIIEDWDVMGMRGSGSNTLYLAEELFVPDYRVIKTMELFSGPRPDPQPAGLLYTINLIQLTAGSFISLGMGLARAAIDELEATAKKRGITFTTYKSQIEAPVTHLQLGELYTRLGTVEAVCETMFARMEAAAEEGVAQTPLDNSRVRCATSYALTICDEIVQTCLRAAGASAIRSSNPLQRIARDMKTTTMHGQMNIETAYEDYGRILAGLPGFQEPPKPPKKS